MHRTKPTHDLHPHGCIAQLLSTIEIEKLGRFLIVRGTQWVKLEAIERTEPFIAANLPDGERI